MADTSNRPSTSCFGPRQPTPMTTAGSKVRGEARCADRTIRGADEEPPVASGPTVDADTGPFLSDTGARGHQPEPVRAAAGAET